MRSRAVPVVLALIAVAGCSRDLAVPPKPSIAALGIVPAFQSAAPREPLQFAGTGGVAPYTFAFAQGGQLSGADASLSEGGAYVAGSNGSAQDVLEVTDSRGVTATATVSVGQRIAITPAFTGTVPGGRTAFQATGGGAPYTYSMGTSGSGGDVSPLGGVYVAGSAGDQTDTVIVADRYGATAKAEIHVGPQLALYRAETRPVAPRESVTLIALGGQPPYHYTVDLPGPYDPAVDATILANGVYTAGSRANDASPYATTTDTVRVTDAANVPQQATLTVAVGPRLRLSMDVTEIFPGQTVQLVASGGKPPYTFGFARRIPAAAGVAGTDPDRLAGGNGGNRSAGAVNALTGEYVPGFSPGALDYLQVTDATSAPAATLQAPRVGSVPLAVGTGVRSCLSGDFNGDGSGDVLLSFKTDNGTKLTTAMMLDTAAPWLQTYFVGHDLGIATVADFSNAGRQSVLVVGGDTDCSSGNCPSPDFWALTPDLVGYLSAPTVSGGGPQQWVNAWNDPPFQNASGTAYHRVTTNWGIRRGGGTSHFDAATSTWQFWGPGADYDTIQSASSSPGNALCDGAGMTVADGWLIRMNWKVGDATPARPTCVKATGLCPTCSSSNSDHAPIAVGVGDFNGDGQLDLAWILDTDRNRIASGTDGAKLYVALAAGGGNFTYSTASWPGSGWSFESPDNGTPQTRFQVVRPPGATTDALMVRLHDSSGHGSLFLARRTAGGSVTWSTALDPTGAGVDGFVAGAGTTARSLYAWSGSDGVVTGLAVDPSFAFTAVAPAATLPFAVNAVCLPDANADGVQDLVAISNLGGTAQLVIGDGTTGTAAAGTFGELIHQRGMAFPIGTGDFDGDGFMDAVVANGNGAGLSILWGGGGMLAWGAQIASMPVILALAGPYSADPAGWPPSILFQERTGRWGKLRNRGDGTFDPAVALSSVTASGAPASSNFFAFPADFGTSEPGLDAVGLANDGTPTAILVQNGRVVGVASKPIPALDALHPNTDDCWPLAVGHATGQWGGIALACAMSNHNYSSGVQFKFAIWGATVSNVDNGPGGSPPVIGDWVLLTSTTASPDPAFSAPIAGGGSRLRLGGMFSIDGAGVDVTAGKAVFAFTTDRLYVIEVSSNGSPSPASWSWQLFPVTPTTTDFYPFLGRAGSLGDPAATGGYSLVVTGGGAEGGVGSGGTVVLRRTNSGYQLVERLGSSGFAMGIGKLAKDSPGDALVFVGDWSNTGLAPEITIRLNDGSGRLK